MNTKKQQFFERLANRTNINNTTNTINSTNILTTSTIVPGSNQEEVDMTSSSSGEDLGGGVEPQVALPPNWFGVKLDLFENDSKLKLSMGVILLKDKSQVKLIAALNSPERMMYRGTQDVNKDDHWRSVRSYEKYLKNQKIDYRCSKFIQPGKRGSVSDMACFVWLDSHWRVTVAQRGVTYEFTLNGKITDRFSKSNGIATAYIGRETQQSSWVSSEELGL